LSSIDWYDANGADFFARSAHVEDLPQRRRFLSHVPDGGRILEAGCGSGRDALAFVRDSYQVTAFDGSATMVALARAHTGLDVIHMNFAEMAWAQVFDGVWACASLLHVPAAELPGTLGRVRRALKPGGVAFASFKLGRQERLANGRRFTDLDPGQLSDLLATAGFEVLETEITGDLRADRQGERWASAIARRPLVDRPPRA
jgi:SAM-dependent methyltransferase